MNVSAGPSSVLSHHNSLDLTAPHTVLRTRRGWGTPDQFSMQYSCMGGGLARGFKRLKSLN